ncbi:MAG TPA: CsgG/HfaB family protein [Stellaceae bacterium]|nr:CsgG/HfaB family protein [Stellaceae bacterium]
MRTKSLLAGAVAIGSLVACSSMETGGGSGTPFAGSGNTAQGSAQLERCPAPLGTIALVESQIPSLAQIGLTSPIPAIRLMAQQSHCFNVVDRGQALTRMREERMLSQGGMLQSGSNVGGGQIVAADYLITPNVTFADDNSGGIGASVGSLIGSYVPHMGLLASTAQAGMHFKEAQAVLAVTDTRSGVQTGVAEGHARASDLSSGLGLVNLPGFASLSGYGNTNQGKVVSAALLDAFNNLVVQLRASPPAH